MKYTLVRLVVIAFVAIFAPILSLNAQEVEKPTPPIDLKKFTPEEVIKLEKMDERALAYFAKSMWSSGGYHFALVYRVARFDIEFGGDNKANVKFAVMKNPIIIQIPLGISGDPIQKGFSPYFKQKGGKIGTMNPVTGEEKYYDW